ncbi:TlpA disulfide reductase family protein [Solirubrum puertoriconensis]|uniref:Thioredoxin domain-containing protein n=1 Tax=Solirubrum puertoriconensis TaxID=1751427 RepID=A0A9X0HMW2_SOLP1|nr:TlpA disulfide reductase family protein [Solirubrum puertoriconensis]KUG08870.1 hypothetical protein ASU33_12160 [Solirubrum puertoriconensis]
MILKNYLILVGAALISLPGLSQSKAPKPNFTLQGNLAGAVAGTKVYLLDDENNHTLGSTTVDAQGHFQLQGLVAEPAVYYLKVDKHPRRVAIALEPGSRLQLKAEAANLRQTARVAGSKDAAVLQRFNDLDEDYYIKVQGIINRRKAAGDEIQRAAINKEWELARKQMYAAMKSIARQQSYVSPFVAVQLMSSPDHLPFIDSIATIYQRRYSQSRYTIELVTYLASQKATAVGAMAPEIMLPALDGKTTALSSLRGKYVVVDFWASWCTPCRRENPDMLKLYNSYKAKGLEIYGVAMDDKQDKWQEAVKQDGITWTQVFDDNKAANPAKNTYGIRALPSTLLLDPQGRIVAKGLRGEELEKKIAELLP